MLRLSLIVLVTALGAQELRPISVDIAKVEFKGKAAWRVTPRPGGANQETMAIVQGTDFENGTIELEMAGVPGAGASEAARGFVGIAFRVQPESKSYECFYLRPTNGRADDQVRRNHSAQYISHPDFPWQRLRKEFPEKYESYVDLEPAVWTKVRIVVSGTKARLYVHGADQPTLIVNDLKLGTGRGAVALWVGPGTEGHFANLRVKVE